MKYQKLAIDSILCHNSAFAFMKLRSNCNQVQTLIFIFIHDESTCLQMIRTKKRCVSDCMVFKIRVVRTGFFLFETYKYAPSSEITQTCFFLSFLLQLINYLTCSTMFLVPNIDQMYKEMKKIVEVRNKHRNGDEFLDFADLFFFLA